MSLEQLITNCKKNDARAQSQIYKLFANKLFSLCLKYSKNYVEAEDNLQDTFVTIFNKINQYKGKGSLEGWMKRIAVNTALQRYRTAGVFDIVNEDQIEDVTVDIDDDDVSIDFLLKIIQELPDRYRLVFNLYALDGYSHKEIAEMLEISSGTSKSNLARARLILKDKIEQFKATLSSQYL
ncbi:RNA polymerase sigma factor [Ichthyenterobacterium sp. W332]|uniref:RNA polymerase sigma factor n=1 Tax=Microcosmobacter mediterraneus TaxID=3075607 RepID=A0ABU2YIV7_9FLAO|nr:RNA polymerase sigma factor [Ichthyenterobacterium sp. W332]MDT0558110.1 RNA polymerase sigma factor [Ichthyenterobacterium sp. W332]